MAVVAASWRTNPGGPLSITFAEAFSRRSTLGQAFVEVKQKMNDRSLVEGYNLFGDPALPLAVPGNPLALRVTGEPRDLRLEIDLGVSAFAGEVVVDWLDERGTVLDSETLELAEPRLALPLHPDAAVRSAAVYAWSLGTGWDAAGGSP